jgi:hypothetical protein
MQLLRFALIILACATLPQIAAAQAPETPPLNKVAEYRLKFARMGAALAPLGDHLYIFGGSGGSEPIYQAERLNLATGESELLPARFLSRRFHDVVEHEGKFYLFGGQGYALPSELLEQRLEVYDPATQTVTLLDDVPEPRQHAGAVKIGTDVYIIGGGRHRANGSYSQTNAVQIYDLTTGKWRAGPAMPTPRECDAVAVGQFVLVAGGYASRNKQDAVEMFVPAEQGWKRLPKLGQPISAHASAVLGRWLFLFGDFDDGSTLLAYDLPTRKTTRLKTNFTETRFPSAITVGDRIYIVGGAALDTGYAGGQGIVRQNRNFARADGTERDLVQVFALAP